MSQYSEVILLLEAASKVASKLNVDLSVVGNYRRVIVAHHLNHTLIKQDLVDAVDENQKTYAYLCAHYGKRAQMFMGEKNPRSGVDKFIVVFFSVYDSSRIFSIWSCSPDLIWEEVKQQQKRKKTKKKAQLAYFSEAWLNKNKNKGAELIFCLEALQP